MSISNYYAAPQQVNQQGLVIGHTHVVIETLSSFDATEPLDPINGFVFVSSQRSTSSTHSDQFISSRVLTVLLTMPES